MHALLIVLYTMGPGADLFSTFGHAAICVRDGAESRCYNYGTADFQTPVPLTWDFIRGRARFWVSVVDEDRMLGWYAAEGRTVWRQVLPLPPDEAARLASALEASTDERVKYYRYHHFKDNCTTRIRDLVDKATGGALRSHAEDRGRSFRDWARAGFRGEWPMLSVVDLLLGEPADHRTDSWDAMFLPSELRREVASRLHAPPVEVVHSSRAAPSGWPGAGELAFALGGLALALFARAGRPGRATVGVVLGLVGAILWALFALSTFPELTRNENLLVFWPSDLFLGALGGAWLRRYLDARLVVLGLVVAAHLVWFVQPLATLLVVALPLASLRLPPSRLRLARRR